MALTRPEAKAKIEKLLAMAKSLGDTPEAATARKQAEALMTKYRFTFRANPPTPSSSSTSRPHPGAARRRRPPRKPTDADVDLIEATLNLFDAFQRASRAE